MKKIFFVFVSLWFLSLQAMAYDPLTEEGNRIYDKLKEKADGAYNSNPSEAADKAYDAPSSALVGTWCKPRALLTLNANGTGTYKEHCYAVKGSILTYNVKWTKKGNDLTVTVISEKLVGDPTYEAKLTSNRQKSEFKQALAKYNATYPFKKPYKIFDYYIISLSNDVMIATQTGWNYWVKKSAIDKYLK